MLKSSVLILFALFFSQAGFAATVRCVNANVRNSPVVLQYDFQDTKSMRIAGNIIIRDEVISIIQVAQHKVSSTGFYLVIDDADTFTTPVYTFSTSSISTTKAFSGALLYNVNGAAKKMTLACRL